MVRRIGRWSVLVVTALCLLLGAATSRAAIKYVAKHGLNSNDGSQVNPWGTIQFGVTNIASYDSLYVGEGTYTESITNPAAFGSPAKTNHNIILQGGWNTNDWSWDPKNHPSIINPGNINRDVLTITPTNNTITGFTLTGGRRGLYGYYIPTAYMTVSHCIIISNSNDGIYLNTSQGALKARNCLIRNNGGYGIQRYIDNGPANYIHNCTIVNNTAGGLYEVYSSAGVNYVRNCIIANNGGYGLRRDSGTYIIRCYASCVFGNTLGNFGGRLAGVGLYSGTRAVDPQFAGGADFHLVDGSICVDRGLDLSADVNLAVTDDLEGNARTAPFDMGCYQSSYAAVTTYADTYADAARSDNSGAGTNWDTAKKSINAALAVTATSGACHVATGAYAEEIVLSQNGVTVAGTNASATVISGGGMQAAAWLAHTNTTLRGVTLTGASNGVFLAGGAVASGIVVDQCVVRGNLNGMTAPSGVDVKGQTYTVTRCAITNNTGNGIYLSGGLNGLLAANCLIGKNGGNGIEVSIDNGNPHYLTNCTIAYNRVNGLYGNQTYAPTFNLANCIVAFNSGAGITRTTDRADYAVSSCVFSNAAGNIKKLFVADPYVIQADPKFVDAANGDFHLQNGSPCVGYGKDLTGAGVTNDLEGTARTAPFDMGCYQSANTPLAHYNATYADAGVGSDSNLGNGSGAGAAKKTIGAALAVIAARGTCNVAAGIYPETAIVPYFGITLQGAGQQSTTITNPGNWTGVYMYESNIVLRGVTVVGNRAGTGVMIGGPDPGLGDVAVGPSPCACLIDQCTIRNWSYGVQTVIDSRLNAQGRKQYQLNRCTISSNSTTGIDFAQAVRATDCLIVNNGISGLVGPGDNSPSSFFLFCTIANNGTNGYWSYQAAAQSRPAYLTNCIVTGNGSVGIRKDGTALNLFVGYSIVSGQPTNFGGTSPGTIVINAGVITNQTPTFKPGGFKLAQGSVGLDIATNIGVTIDLDGGKRPYGAGYDMGAYELPPRQGAIISLR